MIRDRRRLSPLTAALLAALAACGGEQAAPEPVRVPGLPDDSIYHLGSEWQDQDGREVHLPDLQGTVQVTAMIFTHCPYACPAMVENLQRIERGLSEKVRADTRFLLVSMDDARDTPPVLKAFAEKEGIDLQRWQFLHGSADAVREYAAALGFRYAKVEGGDFTHSNLVVVLDRRGRPVFRLEGLDAAPGPAVQAIGLASREP